MANQPTTFIRVSGQLVEVGSIPTPASRTFRDDWELVNGVIEVDMVGAKETHRNKIRQERLSRFDPFDQVAVPLTRKSAVGNALTQAEKDALNAAEAAAQKLRDAPADARIDNATTPEELEALTLDVLIV